MCMFLNISYYEHALSPLPNHKCPHLASCKISSREVGPSPSARWPARMRTGGRSLLHLRMLCRKNPMEKLWKLSQQVNFMVLFVWMVYKATRYTLQPTWTLPIMEVGSILLVMAYDSC